jgi:hypothetical protein
MGNLKSSTQNYRDQVARLRRSHDLYPYIEVYEKQWTLGTTITQTRTIQHKQPRNLLVSELVHLNQFLGRSPGLFGSDTYPRVAWQAQLTTGTQGALLASAPTLAEQIFGSVQDELKRFPTGMRLPPQSVLNIIATTDPCDDTASQYSVGADHRLSLGLRGYQLLPKGSTATPQYTYTEYAERGYRMEPFQAVAHVAIKDASTEQAEAEFTVPEEFESFACDFLTLSFNGNQDAVMYEQTGNFLVKVETPDRPIMQDFCPAPLVGFAKERTAWRFPQPLSLRPGSQVKFKVRQRLPFTWVAGGQLLVIEPYPRLSLVMHGHKLVKA